MISAFLRGVGKWKGCYWPTQFGPEGLNLQGLKSSQAMLMARSTAGNERAAWKAANRWLEEVERDAEDAEEEACLAVDLAILGQGERALEHVERACSLGLKYVKGSVWQPLQSTIREQLACNNGIGSLGDGFAESEHS